MGESPVPGQLLQPNRGVPSAVQQVALVGAVLWVPAVQGQMDTGTRRPLLQGQDLFPFLISLAALALPSPLLPHICLTATRAVGSPSLPQKGAFLLSVEEASYGTACSCPLQHIETAPWARLTPFFFVLPGCRGGEAHAAELFITSLPLPLPALQSPGCHLPAPQLPGPFTCLGHSTWELV